MVVLVDPPTDEISADERELRLVERGIHSGLVDVHYRPLLWQRDRPTVPGWRHARKPGAAEFTIVSVTLDSAGVLVYGVSAVTYRPVEGSELEWGSSVIGVPH